MGRFITVGSALPDIAAAILDSGSVALDLETYGKRKGDGLDPWAGDIRLLSLSVKGQEPWILALLELKSTLEAVDVIVKEFNYEDASLGETLPNSNA
jgi:hypothetical protein